MSLFLHRKRHIEEDKVAEDQSSVEVLEINRQGHRSVDKANREIDKVNRLLKANGITLKIHIATGGHHR